MSTQESEKESEYSDDDIEPKLKYVRVSNDLRKILSSDAASCIAVHPKFLCIGTHFGKVHLLDHQGNTVILNPNPGQLPILMSLPINQINVDEKGEFIAACSGENVVISGLYSSENNHNLRLSTCVSCVALDPCYYKPGSGRRFITGGNCLILHEKTFLSRIRTTILCETNNCVQAAAWKKQFIAWASEEGVRVYDLEERCSLGLINWESNCNETQKYRCNLRWSDSKTLLIGWVDTVRVCIIRKRHAVEVANSNMPEYIVDAVSTFRMDFYIAGLGPLEMSDQLVILGYPRERDPETGKALRPVLCVLRFKDSDYTEICTDSLTLRGYQEYSCNDYHLDCLVEENRFFIVSPKDVIVASPYDHDDKLQWLVDHNKYEQAITTLTENGNCCGRWTLLMVGRKYIDYLLSQNDHDKAAKLCLTVFSNNKTLWEEEVYKFAKAHRLRSVSPYLPRTLETKLDPQIYEMVLYEYLKFEPQGFLHLIREWNPELYNTSAVVSAVLEHLLVCEKDKLILLEALAVLYSHERKYDKALAMYLTLKHKDVFTLIQKHNLYEYIGDKIPALMNLDVDHTVALLMEKKISSDAVVRSLQSHKEYLYRYLDSYDKVDSAYSGKYHELMVDLYATYCPTKLLPFLKRSNSYDIPKALKICQDKKFHKETAYLLGRIGRPGEALQIMIHDLDDIDSAIDFCQGNKDPELWHDLIALTLSRPHLIAHLLKSIGAHVDPRLLVQEIKSGVVIPDLKDALVKMMCDYNLQVSVQEGCNQILVSDYFNLHEKLVLKQQQGMAITDEHHCEACRKKIIIKDISRVTGLVVFNCHHLFHESCLPIQAVRLCAVCNPVSSILSN